MKALKRLQDQPIETLPGGALALPHRLIRSNRPNDESPD
jgi:hypothetical protein